MNLDDQKIFAELDTGKVAESIKSLYLQMRQVLEQSDSIKIPKEYGSVTQVVVNGMGGSNIGVGLAQAALSDRWKAPISITPGYEVLASVNEKTLYLISSYSGNTEEPLSVYEEIKRRGAKIMAICEAGDNRLSRLMEKDNLPGYRFKADHNSNRQPN